MEEGTFAETPSMENNNGPNASNGGLENKDIGACCKVISPTEMRDVLEKSGLVLKVPLFHQNLGAVGTSREHVRGVAAKLNRATFGGERRMVGNHKSIVTLPVSAKQWLLHAIGLKDVEIRDLFNQVESMPQLAAEYIREVKSEWEALEARDNKTPPEVEFLLKDQSLLERVRSLIMHFTQRQGCQTKMDKEDQCKEKIPQDTYHDRINQERIERIQSESYVGSCEMNSHIHSTYETTSVKGGFEKKSSKGKNDDQTAASKSLHHSLNPFHIDSQVGQNAKDNSSQLPSFIPVEDYIINQSVVQPQMLGKPEYKSIYSTIDKRWYTILFPALQPGRREDVRLLWDWLQHALERNHCEIVDGQFVDVEATFVLHSIAFLEIIRQVELQCEERGNLLLHIWRQLLRIFNQVMGQAEPSLSAKDEEMRQLKNHLELVQEELVQANGTLDAVRDDLKQKEAEMRKIKRCRLCVCENMTPRSREDMVRKVKARPITEKRTYDFTISKDEGAQDSAATTVVAANVTSGSGSSSSASVAQHAVLDSREATLGSPRSVRKAEAVAKETGASVAGFSSFSSVSLVQKEGGSVGQDALVFDGAEAMLAAVVGDEGVREDERKSVATQTEKEVRGERLRRCKSAPVRMMYAATEARPSKLRVEAREVFKRELTPAEMALKEEAEFQKLLGLPAIGSIAIPSGIIGLGGERLSEFEVLAVDAIGLFEKLPITEGSLASSMKTLLERFSTLTGYVPKSRKAEEVVPAVGEGEGDQDADADEKGRKKSQFKAKLQAKYYVPIGFSKMMKINTVPKNIKTFNVRQVSKLAALIYTEKIEADAVDDAADNERQTCCEFVYDFMLNQYGLKGIADAAIHGVFKTIKSLISSKQIEKYHKVRLFSRFVAMDENRWYSESDLYLYLKLLQRAMSKVGALVPSEQDDGIVFMNITFLDIIMDEPNLVDYFGSEAIVRDFILKYAAKNTITEKASPEIKKLVKESEVKKMDWDLMMEAIIDFHPHTEERRQTMMRKATQVKAPLTKDKQKELENLFIAGDANQDGVLTFTEFREIISSADPSVSTQSALRMFRETLLMMPDGGDNISPLAFATIAHNHGISAPPNTVFELLKKTWSQVKGDINEDKMQLEAEKQEFEGLKQSLLFLVAERKNVTEAVQVFRSLILKFCGGNEEAEGDNPVEDEPPPENTD